MKRAIFYTLAAVVLIIVVGAGGIFFGFFQDSVVSADVEEPLAPDQMETLARRGAYVAVAADCYACHTAKGGAPYAGGLPFDTPFGTIYSTNISPDEETGIGDWSRADFHRALRDGVGKGGKHLYPAMPYTSYRSMTPEDVDAVYAFLMTRPAMKVENRRNDLPFPFNIRRSLAFWNIVNLSGGDEPVATSRSDMWNRGRYLVDALAHCGECHTPRNLMQAMETDRYLEGAVLEGIEAPDITTEGLARMGFDAPTLAAFMKTGVAAQGAMAHQMFEVVHFSTQYMTEDDLAALSAYLFDLDTMPDEATPPPAPVPVEVEPALAASARATYLDLCAGCHGAEGQGIPNVVVPLDTNAVLRIADPRNLLQTVLHGLPAQNFPGLARMEPMPGFDALLDDEQAADLANWMRARWGGQEPGVTAEDVKRLRKQPAS